MCFLDCKCGMLRKSFWDSADSRWLTTELLKRGISIALNFFLAVYLGDDSPCTCIFGTANLGCFNNPFEILLLALTSYVIMVVVLNIVACYPIFTPFIYQH